MKPGKDKGRVKAEDDRVPAVSFMGSSEVRGGLETNEQRRKGCLGCLGAPEQGFT